MKRQVVFLILAALLVALLAGSSGVHGQEDSWFGASVASVPLDLAKVLGMEAPQGALVYRVRPGSPAALAGVEAGDVIVRFAGTPVTGPEHLSRLLAGTSRGQVVEVVCQEEFGTRSLQVPSGPQSSEPAGASEPSALFTPMPGSAGPGEPAALFTPAPTQASAARKTAEDPFYPMGQTSDPSGYSQSPDGRTNLKPEFIFAVKSWMEDSQGTTLSSEYFSVGKVGTVISAVSGYLDGVAVDPEYLRNFKWGQLLGQLLGRTVVAEGGLAQPKGLGAAWDSAVTLKEQRYNGWVVLARPPHLDDAGRMTAFHEAIHVLHLKMGSSVDGDSEGGPETISNGFSNLVCTLRDKVDPALDRVLEKIDRGQPYEKDLEDLRTRLRSLKGQTDDYSADCRQCLQNVGGRMDWAGYQKAVDDLVARHVADAGSGGAWVRGRLLAGPVPIPANLAEPTPLGVVLEQGRPYIIVGQGSCSLWDGQEDGCDSVYRYRTPLEEGGGPLKIWGQLRLVDPDGHLCNFMEQELGKAPDYNPSHEYQAVVTGTGATVKALVHDGGGYSDNHGQLEVSVYEAVRRRP